jgi:hypothetical protein
VTVSKMDAPWFIDRHPPCSGALCSTLSSSPLAGEGPGVRGIVAYINSPSCHRVWYNRDMLDKIQYLLLWTFAATFVISAIVRFANRKTIESAFELSFFESVVLYLWLGFMMAKVISDSHGARFVLMSAGAAFFFVMAMVAVFRAIRRWQGVNPAGAQPGASSEQENVERKPQLDPITLMAWGCLFGLPAPYICDYLIVPWLTSPAIGLTISEGVAFLMATILMVGSGFLGITIATRRARKREHAVNR